MPEQPVPVPVSTSAFRWKQLIILFAVIIVAGLFGAGIARSNSDIICTKTTSDEGACTGGSWGDWTTTAQTPDSNACVATYVDVRTYTGLRNIINAVFQVTANAHTYCNLGESAYSNAQGTITSQYSACQIQETRTRAVAGTGTGASCRYGTISTSTGTIISDNHFESTGAISTTTSVTGTYQDYLAMVDARLATTSLQVVPTLVRSGGTTQVIWASSHVKSCEVTATNGDHWTGGSSAAGGETSAPIESQTTYTLKCTTAIGTVLTQNAIVGIIPVFNEQ